MTIYQSTITYSVERICVRDAVDKQSSMYLAGKLFIEKNGDIPLPFDKSLAWLQTLSPNKVLYVLKPIDETHRLSKNGKYGRL